MVGNGPEIKPGLDELHLGHVKMVDITIPTLGHPRGRQVERRNSMVSGWRWCWPRRPVRTECGRVGTVKTIAERVAEDRKQRAEAAARLMAAGVTIYRPETCVIDTGIEVAADTVIEPFVQLLGQTRIGANCLILVLYSG